MDRRWILAGGGLLLFGITGVAMVTAEPSDGPIFIAGETRTTKRESLLLAPILW